MKHLCLKTKEHQSGSIMIFVLLILPLLLVMAGIGGDIGKLYVSKAELQSAADACALAAAAQFDGSANQTTKATTAGSTVAIQNNVVFQKNAITNGDVQITFPTNLNGVAGTYAQCNITRTGIANWITPVLNLIGGNVGQSETVSATAVATTIPGQSTCALPVAICDSQIVGKNRGDWLQGILAPSNGNNNQDEVDVPAGSFKWVDLTPENGGGANEIAGILDGTNSTSCSVSVAPDTNISKQGFNGNARRAYNKRFGVKQNQNDTTPILHVTGKGYYLVGGAPNPGRFDSADYANAVQSNTPYSALTGINVNPLRTSTVAQHSAGRTDSRVATVAVADCSGATLKLKSFACVFLLHPLPTTNASNFNMFLEYLGNPSTAITPCNPSALAGTGIGPRVSALVQ